MPTILIRDVPESLYRTLVEAAANERRSWSEQAILTLQRGLTTEGHRRRRGAVLEEVRKRPIKILDPVAMIRADRNR